MFDNKEDILNDLFGEIIEDTAKDDAEVEAADEKAEVEDTNAEAADVKADANDVKAEASEEKVDVDGTVSSDMSSSKDDSTRENSNGRISNVDEIMGDVEFVMTREINPEDVEKELNKRNSKKAEKKAKQKAAEAAAREEVKPEERRAIRRQKRKHDRRVAVIGVAVVLVILAVAGFFGKGFLDNYMENRAENEPTPAVVETVEEPEVVVETPTIEFTPEIIEEPEEVEPEVVEPEETPEEMLDTMIDEMIAQMPLEDKVAGLFIVTPEALTGQDNVTKAGDGTKTALEEYAVGGIVYFKSNIKSADQVKEMISNTASYSRYPLFFAVDEEGGDVARVQSGLKLSKTPTAEELGNSGDPETVYSTYSEIGTYLSEYGFNLDFAPVADVLTNPDNKAIGNRSFSSQSTVVANMIPRAVAGLQDSGVSACLKHWPGQGDADADTHDGMATISKTQTDMEQIEFEPFRTGIAAGVDMVMVSHIAAPEITGDNTPCSLSKDVVTGILRDEMDYNGIIVTDALNMSAISEYYGADEAAIKALKAGCDILLMPEDFQLAYAGVITAVADGTISEERINDCLKRVYRVKYADTLSE